MASPAARVPTSSRKTAAPVPASSGKTAGRVPTSAVLRKRGNRGASKQNGNG
jgi:hypothetical protein